MLRYNPKQILQVTELESVEVRENQLQQSKIKKVPAFQSSEHISERSNQVNYVA